MTKEIMNETIEWTKLPLPEKLTPETPESPELAPEALPRSADLRKGAETVPETPETPEVGLRELEVREILQLHLRRWENTFLPPDILHTDRPSLLKVIAYAWAGDWGPASGPIRTLGRLDMIIIGVPMVTLFYSLAWTIERPGRRWAITALAVVTALFLGWL